METYKKYKELANVIWLCLNDKSTNKAERQKDVQAFNQFFNIILLIVHFFFGVFSLISVYFFITRVIF